MIDGAIQVDGLACRFQSFSPCFVSLLSVRPGKAGGVIFSFPLAYSKTTHDACIDPEGENRIGSGAQEGMNKKGFSFPYSPNISSG